MGVAAARRVTASCENCIVKMAMVVAAAEDWLID